MDTLDGVVAKAAGTASNKGAFFDSVADRVSDALIFGGVAWYFASGSDPRLAVLPFAIFGVSAVISYERAKAESLGYDAKGGLMERAERLILLGVALLLHVIFVPLLGAAAGADGLHRCAALREGLAPGEPGDGDLRGCAEGRGARAASSRAGRPGVSRAPGHQAAGDHAEPAYVPGGASEPLGVRLAPRARQRALAAPRSAPGSRSERRSFVHRIDAAPPPGADS